MKTWRHWVENRYYNFKSHKIYTAYLEYIRKELKESTWIDKYLNNGWESLRQFDGNWFGCSTYHPDQFFRKGNKTIVLSLQGLTTPTKYNGNEIDEGYLQVAKDRGIKYMKFQEGDKVLYENWYGELPSNEFIENFR